MQSRRDQVDAQRYLNFRLTGALVRADPDALESPTRRDVRSLVAGSVVALLMLGGVAAWAWLASGGSTAWRQPGVLIIDRSTGTRFLFLDGVLRPVRNVASARLLVDGNVKPLTVAGSRLAGVPRGAPLGVVGGPEILPDAGRLNAGVWRACAQGSPDTADTAAAVANWPRPAGGAGDRIVVEVAGPPAAARVGRDEGLLVSSEGTDYLLWRGRRLELARPWAADVLGWGGTASVPVPAAFLELVPAGPELAPVAVPERGTPGPDIGGRPTSRGDLFAVATAAGQTAYYLLLPTGLAPLTATQFALTQAEPGTAPARRITSAELAAAPRARVAEPASLLPARPPVIVEPRGDTAAVCVETVGVPAVFARSTEPAWRARVAGATASPGAPAQPPPPAGPASGAPTDPALALVLAPGPLPAGTPEADVDVDVRVQARGGALLVPDADVPVDQQQCLLVDGAGTAFPLTPDAVEALGYRLEQAIEVPRQLPLLLPRGPSLDLIGRAAG
ncbi:type VII secretion protein EccB [Parafrankia colletiae]|uniref:Type VII secretion protein EccB n=1 Tax=Parafrankia colletiae TaxID=573497 RepID=A0A1S1QB67_9ACTN|nr:type VII secretion protein EccB [Parafrankia colletiae]MCK9904850.1 type VII secretion protein EccB [Frankia sp. Cpl3]OHV30836.1 type VII secretion protein EccB [Parafrankia colletiae]